MSQQRVILLLGSNLGNQKKNLVHALHLIEDRIGIIRKKSKFLKTQPIEFVSHNIFYNFAVAVDTNLSPIKLLDVVKEIEWEMGRTKDSKVIGSYADRIIDIDIVTYGDIRFFSDRLKIPHIKHLYERAFSIQLISEITEKT